MRLDCEPPYEGDIKNHGICKVKKNTVKPSANMHLTQGNFNHTLGKIEFTEEIHSHI